VLNENDSINQIFFCENSQDYTYTGESKLDAL